MMTKQMKNPCWPGYEAYGFKEKDGRRVPNCIPTKSFSSLEMPFKLERWGDKAIVVNATTGKHYSNSPIPVVDATKQMRILEAYKKEKESKHEYEAERSALRHDVDPKHKKFIQEVVSSPDFKKGAFTAEAKRAGMTTKQFMEDVLAHPESHSLTTRRRAQFMKNILK